MRKGLGLLFLPVLFLFLVGQASAEVRLIGKEELRQRLGEPGLAVVDVRSGADWTGSDQKIKGAVREDPRAVEDWAGKYPKESPIALYCA